MAEIITILNLIVLTFALINLAKYYKKENARKQLEKEEQRELIRKHLENVISYEKDDIFSDEVMMWFEDFKRYFPYYILTKYTMYNEKYEEEEENPTEIWVANDVENRRFYSRKTETRIRKNEKLTTADKMLLEECKKLLEHRDHILTEKFISKWKQ